MIGVCFYRGFLFGQQPEVALHGLIAIAQGLQRHGLRIRDGRKVSLVFRQGGQHLGGKGGHGQGLTETPHGPQALQCSIGGRIKSLRRQIIAHRFHAVTQALTLVFYPPHAVIPGPPAAFAVGLGCQFRHALGRPAMHPAPALLIQGHQGKGGQAIQTLSRTSLVGFLLRGVRQHAAQALGTYRKIRNGHL